MNVSPHEPGPASSPSEPEFEFTPFQRRVLPLFQWLARYHQYEVHGFENIPRTGPALLVTNHSFATYDALLLGVHMMLHIGRFPRVLADRTFFATPGLRDIVEGLGFVEGSRDAAADLLRSGQIVGAAPGGMRESLRDSRHKYRFDWKDRFGFVWTALTTGSPIVLGACPSADDIFDLVPNPVTPWVYKRLRLPFPILRGRAGLPVPRPVKLWHLLSEPIIADVPPDKVRREDVERHHGYLVERMTTLMADAAQIENR